MSGNELFAPIITCAEEGNLMDASSLVLLILALLVGAPIILFYLGERVNRAVDEDRNQGKRPPKDRP